MKVLEEGLVWIVFLFLLLLSLSFSCRFLNFFPSYFFVTLMPHQQSFTPSFIIVPPNTLQTSVESLVSLIFKPLFYWCYYKLLSPDLCSEFKHSVCSLSLGVIFIWLLCKSYIRLLSFPWRLLRQQMPHFLNLQACDSENSSWNWWLFFCY